MDWYYRIVLSKYETVTLCLLRIWYQFMWAVDFVLTVFRHTNGSRVCHWDFLLPQKTRLACPVISHTQCLQKAVRSQLQICRVLTGPIPALPPAQLLLSRYNHSSAINDPQHLLEKTGTRLANHMRGKQNGWTDPLGTCDWTRKNTHLNIYKGLNPARNTQALLSLQLSLGLWRLASEAGAGGGSLWTPHPAAVPIEITLQGGDRDRKVGGHTRPSVTLVGQTHCIPRSECSWVLYSKHALNYFHTNW